MWDRLCVSLRLECAQKVEALWELLSAQCLKSTLLTP